MTEKQILDSLYPAKCPITRRDFFMLIEHPELGLVPTYGGPFDSYTIPEMDGEPDQPFHQRELFVRRYDHDAGCWKGNEYIPLRVVHEDQTEMVDICVGDTVTVHDRFRFAIPLKGEVKELIETNSVVVTLLESSDIQWPVGGDVLVHLSQLRRCMEQPRHEVRPVIDRKFIIRARNPINGKRYDESNSLLLCAKDAAVPAALIAYRNRCVGLGANKEHIDSINLLIDRVVTFQTLQGGGRTPDTVGEEIPRCLEGKGL
jgi:hypothetical protein